MLNSENAPDKKQGQNNLNFKNSIAKFSSKSKHYGILRGFNSLKNEKIFILYNHLKRPISPLTGKAIGINNKKHFVDLQTAIKALEKHKIATRVGIILGETSMGNICAIDIDKCISNSKKLPKEVQEILDSFSGTYIEISQSQTGMHILFFGKKKDDCRCKISRYNWCKSLECYDHERYIALTGNVLQPNSSLKNCQSELNAFCDKHLHINLKSFNNKINYSNKLKEGLQTDKKFTQLWQGNRLFKDESRCDLALMAKIMYWTGYDIDYSIKAFKSSPYVAQKDDLHKLKMKRADYLIRTAKKCLEGV